MKIVNVEVLPLRPQEQVGATIIVEKRRGDTWTRSKAFDVTSGTPEANRRILLDDDERVVIEGAAKTIMQYDPVQNAAKIVAADPEVREKEAQLEAAQDDVNRLKEQKARDVKDGQASAAQAGQLRTNIGNPVPPPIPPKPYTPPPQTAPSTLPPQSKPAGALNADTGQGARDSKDVK